MLFEPARRRLRRYLNPVPTKERTLRSTQSLPCHRPTGQNSGFQPSGSRRGREQG